MRPAVTLSGDAAILAWWNSPSNGAATGLAVARVLNGTVMQRAVLPLGHMPRELSLYPGTSGLVQALWLDNADLPGESRLYDAVIGPDLTLQRGPTLISSADTIQYAAVVLPSNALAVTWTAHTGLTAQPLYLQAIDADGRPRAAIAIDKDARDPTLAISDQALVYIAWLTPQPDAIETVELAQYPADFAALTSIEANTSPIPSAIPIGIIASDANHTLENFTLGVQSNVGYLVWSEADISGQSNGNEVVYALTFPLDHPAVGRQITVSENARWPVLLNHPFTNKDNALPISLTLADGSSWTPAVIWLANGQVSRIDRFGSSGETIEQSALALNGDTLIATYAVLANNGAPRIYLSARPVTPD